MSDVTVFNLFSNLNDLADMLCNTPLSALGDTDDEYYDFLLSKDDPVESAENIAESIVREYGRPMFALSTEIPLYWFCARALRMGDTAEAERLWQCGDIVWC